MEVKIQQWRNCAAIRLPSTTVRQLRLGVGEARGARRVEAVPEAVIEDALARVQTLFDRA